MWHRDSFTSTNRRTMGQILIGVDSSSADPLCSRASSVSLFLRKFRAHRVGHSRGYGTSAPVQLL